MSMKISIDTSWCSAVVMCECGWRTVARNREHAWLLAARHLKSEHGDLNAGYHARNNAVRIHARAEDS